MDSKDFPFISKYQVRDCGLSFRVPSFSRPNLRHVSFKFVIASRSESLHSRIFQPVDDTVCRAAPVAALTGLLAELDNVSRASRQYPWRLTGRQSHQPLVFSRGDGSP